jgi:hypothetical protein
VRHECATAQVIGKGLSARYVPVLEAEKGRRGRAPPWASRLRLSCPLFIQPFSTVRKYEFKFKDGLTISDVDNLIIDDFLQGDENADGVSDTSRDVDSSDAGVSVDSGESVRQDDTEETRRYWPDDWQIRA